MLKKRRVEDGNVNLQLSRRLKRHGALLKKKIFENIFFCQIDYFLPSFSKTTMSGLRVMLLALLCSSPLIASSCVSDNDAVYNWAYQMTEVEILELVDNNTVPSACQALSYLGYPEYFQWYFENTEAAHLRQKNGVAICMLRPQIAD